MKIYWQCFVRVAQLFKLFLIMWKNVSYYFIKKYQKYNFHSIPFLTALNTCIIVSSWKNKAMKIKAYLNAYISITGFFKSRHNKGNVSRGLCLLLFFFAPWNNTSFLVPGCQSITLFATQGDCCTLCDNHALQWT